MPTANKRLKKLRERRKDTDTKAISPADRLKSLKERLPLNRGQPAKPVTAEEILRAKKKSIAKKPPK